MARILIMAPRVSEGARALKESLNSLDDTRAWYRHQQRQYGLISRINLAVNWGCGSNANPNNFNAPSRDGIPILNRNTTTATNKLHAFQAMARYSTANLHGNGIRTPSFTTSFSTARQWADQGGVFCRTELRGHSGTDIVVARQAGDVVQAPLYTKLVDKRHEFRLHVAGGQVIDGVRKAFRQDVPESERNYDVRNHAAGSVFIRSGRSLTSLQLDPVAQAMAINACRALELDFGAVDMMTDQDGNYYVLEVNTAPGLEATTLARYTDAFHKISQGESVTPWQNLPLNPNNTETETTETNIANNQEATMPAANRINIARLLTNRNAREQFVGTAVTPTGEFRGSTLTAGRGYPVESCTVGDGGGLRFTLRNDQGRIQRYSVNTENFVIGGVSTPRATPLPEPAVDNNVDRQLPVDSPLRCVSLNDGTSVNVGGQVTFTQSGSRYLNQGSQYQVAEIRVGERSGTVFLGIETDDGIRRWRLDSFTNGERVSALGQPTAQAATNNGQPVIQSGNNQPIQQGVMVRVMTRNGGHGIPVGTTGPVASVNPRNNTLTIQGQSRAINARRVNVVTQSEIDQENQIQQQQNETTSITVAGTQYRIRTRSIQQVRDLLNTLTV